MLFRLINPIEAHMGYTENGKFHVDLFLYSNVTCEVFPELTKFKKFTASLKLNSNFSIRMTETQAGELGVSKKYAIPDNLLRTFKTKSNNTTLSYEGIIDYIIPIMKVSEPLKLYSYFATIYRIQVIPDSENDLQKHDEVLIGLFYNTKTIYKSNFNRVFFLQASDIYNSYKT